MARATCPPQVEAQLAGFRRELARRRADLRRDLRLVGVGEEEMQAGIRAMLKQLGKTLKQRERVTVESILGSAQVGPACVRHLSPCLTQNPKH